MIPTASGRGIKPELRNKSGKDHNSGSKESPWKTIQKATDSVPANATIVVRSGTYAPFSVQQNGVTETAETGATVTVQGQSGIRDVVLLGANDVTLSNMDVQGCIPSEPMGSYEDNGNSGVCIDDGTSGVTIDTVLSDWQEITGLDATSIW
jgi:hypothetical protein